MHLIETSLAFLSERAYAVNTRLKDAVREYLFEVVEAQEMEMWSNVFDDGPEELFTDTLHANESGAYLPRFSRVLTKRQVSEHLHGWTVIEVRAKPAADPGNLPTPRLIIGFTTETAPTPNDHIIIGKILEKIVSDCFQTSIRHIHELIVDAAHQSKDLTSFLHRSIQFILLPQFKFYAASIFYHESKTRSLILGATTGIVRQEKLGLKRSDVRYFVDDKSYTAECWRIGKEIVENEFHGGHLKANTMGETVGTLHSRIYAPLRRWTGRTLENASPIGVVRAVNCNSDANFHPITAMEATRLRVFCDAASVVTERYVRNLSILHDQERATHGYNTDLAAIRYAAQNIQKWLGRFEEADLPKEHLDRALQEVGYRVRDILAVQDNMASQIITVMHYSGGSRLVSRETESIVCNQPFTDVIMRLVHAKKGMSEFYGRRELRLTFNGKMKADDLFIKLPPLKITVGYLYLVFRNLAENAIKYSRKGLSPELDISWKENRESVEFIFSDKGIGIPQPEHHLVLREGFRGRQAQELQLRGNGLGLAVSKGALEAVGGELRFHPYSDDTPGSRFVVRVPIQ